MNTEIDHLFESQKAFLATGLLRTVNLRLNMLSMLESAIKSYEERILLALKQDLGKPEAEAWGSEIGLVYSEIKYVRRHLRSWSRTKKVGTPLFLAFSSSKIVPTPYGVSLIIAPWNYPFQLSIAPMVAAIAAGNTVILKPSELAPATADVITDMINEFFTPEYLAVMRGGAELSQALIKAKPDLIFYTGSSKVGKAILHNAADQLIPVILELGGKSPCIVLDDADLVQAARRIAWGKFLNCGQTCVAPDFVLVDEKIKRPFIAEITLALREFYAPQINPEDENAVREAIRNSPDFGRIINDNHFLRLESYLTNGKIIFGGDSVRDQRYFAPTLLDNPEWDSPVMTEEIFGPILPIMGFTDLEDALAKLSSRPKPLAFYLFTGHPGRAKRIMQLMDFGGACLNDTVMHQVNSRLPFGGVGESGMGSYHGKAGFDAFTYSKSILSHAIFPHLRLRYPPYEGKLNLFRRFMS